MNAEFNWWLLIVGLVAGAGFVWLVIADWSRREEDVAEDERSVESAWIAQALGERGMDLDPDAAEQVLALHRDYLRETGALEADAPSDWDEPGHETAWPNEIDTETRQHEYDDAPEAGPGDDAGDARWTTRATEAAGSAGAAAGAAERAATDGLGPAGAAAVPASNGRSVRADPLSPRGPATGSEPDRGPEPRQS